MEKVLNKETNFVKMKLQGVSRIRLTKQDDYSQVSFDHFGTEQHFLGSWGGSKNSLEPQIQPQ